MPEAATQDSVTPEVEPAATKHGSAIPRTVRREFWARDESVGQPWGRSRNFRPDGMFSVSDCRPNTMRKLHNIKHIVIADDASYSGLQLALFISELSNRLFEVRSGIQVHVVIPYMSNEALTRIKLLPHKFKSLNFYNKKQILKAAEAVDPTQAQLINKKSMLTDDEIKFHLKKMKWVHIFNFKIPDDVSLPTSIEFHNFREVSPYKDKNWIEFSDIESLKYPVCCAVQ